MFICSAESSVSGSTEDYKRSPRESMHTWNKLTLFPSLSWMTTTTWLLQTRTHSWRLLGGSQHLYLCSQWVWQQMFSQNFKDSTTAACLSKTGDSGRLQLAVLYIWEPNLNINRWHKYMSSFMMDIALLHRVPQVCQTFLDGLYSTTAAFTEVHTHTNEALVSILLNHKMTNESPLQNYWAGLQCLAPMLIKHTRTS